MKINLPNQITITRLGLTVVFLGVLAQFSMRESPPRLWLLDVCAALFFVAAMSDILDGYLARKWNEVTSFGRVIDPFVDKILVCGAFAFFAGPGFTADGRHASDVSMWMAVVMLGRELLVTGIRGFSEARGESFAAKTQGKVKMVLQSVTAIAVLLTVGHPDTWLFGWQGFVVLRKILVWSTVILTIVSMVTYLSSARHILAETARRAETA